MVVAVDSDPMPGLCFGLGLPLLERPIPDDAVVEKLAGEDGPRFRLRPGLDAWAALNSYAAIGGDNVRFLSFEKSRGDWGQTARSQHAWSQIVAELPRDGFDLVGDLPGGTRQPMTGWGKFADVILVVVEPTSASMLTARRLANLRTSRWDFAEVVAVANRVSEAEDAATIAQRTGLTVIGAVPFDREVSAADRLGRSPLDTSPDCAFVRSVDVLVNVALARYDPQFATVSPGVSHDSQPLSTKEFVA